MNPCSSSSSSSSSRQVQAAGEENHENDFIGVKDFKSIMKVLKGMRSSGSNDFDNLVAVASGAGKKRKRKLQSEKIARENNGLEANKKPLIVLDPSTVLPQVLRNKIDSLGGTEVNFVLQKRFSGVAESNSKNLRLTIPSDKINMFLREKEKSRLGDAKRRKKVKLIDQSCREFDMDFRRWDFRSELYVLTTNWKDVVRQNDLKNDDQIKLWSFRVDNDKLRFALQKL